MNKKYLLVFLGILLSVALLLGSSYAYWMMSHTQTNENLVNSRCFSTSFTEVENSSINLTGSYPLSDKDGMKTVPYEFTITNTCDIYASYSINMEVLSSTTLSHDLIKAVLDNNTPKVATEYESTTATIDGATSYVLLTGGLDADKSQTFKFRMWIDEAGTLENSQNKVIDTKIVVVTTASSVPTLTELLLAQYQESNVTGLLRDSVNPDLYYYQGTNEEVANNFLWYGGHQWRVLEFDTKNDTVTLISQQPLTSIQPASAAWTNEEEYSSSYINQWLNDYFYNSLDDSVQENIIESTFNIGIYTNISGITTKTNVGLLDRNQYEKTSSFREIGDMYNVIAYIESGGDYLSMEDFLQAEGYASMDEYAQDRTYWDDETSSSKNYENFDAYLLGEYGVTNKEDFIGIITNNSEAATGSDIGSTIFKYDESKDVFYYKFLGNSFLSIDDEYWVGNVSDCKYGDELLVVYDDHISDAYIESLSGVRPVIKISNLTITGGDGSIDDNYRSSIKAISTSNIHVGEYINVPYNGSDSACGDDNMCTMRVVAKDNDKIKVSLNGLLPVTSAWAADANDNITTTDAIYTNALNPFIANIDAKYIIEGTFGVGIYEEGNSYTVPASTTIIANVGLPTVGEMFSGNDIDISETSKKAFVDVTTIENPMASNYYWTMNRYSSSNVWHVNDYGGMYSSSVSGTYGVRAVLYLKSGTSALTFTGGEGTAQNPYTLD